MTYWTEEAIAAALEGKFFRVDGTDRNEEERERALRRAAMVERVKQYNAARAAKALKKSNAFTPERIIHAVSIAHDVPAADIVSKARFRHIIIARHHAIALIRELTGMSMPDIADAVNLEDHSTVSHACATWKKRGAPFEQQDITARRLLGMVA